MGDGSPPYAMHPRVRRVLERLYAQEGVAAARVWLAPGAVYVAIGGAGSPRKLLRAAEGACQGLEEPGEAWSFGLLAD